jgi:hypothetical protein
MGKHFMACVKAGATGQPMPTKADRTTGKIVAISSAVGGGAAILGFIGGRLFFGPRAVADESDK